MQPQPRRHFSQGVTARSGRLDARSGKSETRLPTPRAHTDPEKAFIIGFVKSWKLTLVLVGVIAVIGVTMGASSTYAMKINQRSMRACAQGASVAKEVLSSVRNAMAFGIQAELAGANPSRTNRVLLG